MSERSLRGLVPDRSRKCLVCGENSYSLSGIHPQCAARQYDESNRDRLKRENAAAKESLTSNGSTAKAATAKPTAARATATSTWQKNCPKCGMLQHVRKSVCVCGHRFAVRVRLPEREDL